MMRAPQLVEPGGSRSMTTRFDGQSVLITGGARGMGAAHVRGFVAEGAHVVIADGASSGEREPILFAHQRVQT
jgi:NAD(P)-dependent dehydrogenase (short-subunit alcohol dehydrogenase family)